MPGIVVSPAEHWSTMVMRGGQLTSGWWCSGDERWFGGQ
jgi:hypothetical protein